MIRIAPSTNKKGYYKVYTTPTTAENTQSAPPDLAEGGGRGGDTLSAPHHPVGTQYIVSFEESRGVAFDPADFELLGSLPAKLIPAEYFLPDTLHPTRRDTLNNASTCIDDTDFIAFVKDWVYQNARSKLLDYLAKAEKTTYDCRLYLKKWDVPTAVINAIIDDAKEKNWLSDERYALLYTEEALLYERSPIETKHKLIQKRIAPNIIEKAIKKVFDKSTTKDLIKTQIDRLITRYPDLPPQKLFEKIATALYRKGFKYSDYEDILKKRLTI